MQKTRPRWQSWLDAYVQFLDTDRGLSASAQSHYGYIAERYLAWQFRRRPVNWRRVRPQDIWRYVRRLRWPGRKAQGLNSALSALRQFLRFVHLRGGSTVALAEAVPTISGGPRSLVRPALSAEHRRQLLACFDRHSFAGVRDYAMARCMTDLGLRCVEVARLGLHDLDWPRQLLSVPPAKNGRGRLLPMPRPVTTALRHYVEVRPPTDHPYVFVDQCHAAGRPLTPPAIRAAMEKAYRRCGFSWYGTHRLRRGFATRLYAGGANLKEIADLLGHRFVTTTERYAQVDPNGLVALIRPWPL